MSAPKPITMSLMLLFVCAPAYGQNWDFQHDTDADGSSSFSLVHIAQNDADKSIVLALIGISPNQCAPKEVLINMMVSIGPGIMEPGAKLRFNESSLSLYRLVTGADDSKLKIEYRTTLSLDDIQDLPEETPTLSGYPVNGFPGAVSEFAQRTLIATDC